MVLDGEGTPPRETIEPLRGKRRKKPSGSEPGNQGCFSGVYVALEFVSDCLTVFDLSKNSFMAAKFV